MNIFISENVSNEGMKPPCLFPDKTYALFNNSCLRMHSFQWCHCEWWPVFCSWVMGCDIVGFAMVPSVCAPMPMWPSSFWFWWNSQAQKPCLSFWNVQAIYWEAQCRTVITSIFQSLKSFDDYIMRLTLAYISLRFQYCIKGLWV